MTGAAAGLLLTLALAEPNVPDPASRPLLDCSEIEEVDERLACYDALAREARARGQESLLDRHWDLTRGARLLRPWPHRPNYLLPARWSSDPNEEPFRTVADEEPESLSLQSVELKFQLSFKTKVWDGILGGPGALWLAYTQQSHFQVYNADASRPFRETDYEPEIIGAWPVRQQWGDWTWRVVGAGLVHQSNGRSEPLSRSWNRVYALLAVERPGIAIHLRPWVRIDTEGGPDDDNPGITDYVGRMEITAALARGRHLVNLRGRTNLDVHGHHGSLQADWFWPITTHLRGQVQVFTGYGESLIDYNHDQTTVGVGILVFDRI